MKEWTREEVERLVPEATRVEESKVIPGAIEFSIDGYIGHTAYGPGVALLQTRLDLETARNDMVDGAMKFDDKVIECSRLRGALERITELTKEQV